MSCFIDRSKLVENYSKPSIANFGRSLFGGYCPTYVPDFVLHGMPSDEKLRQNLMTELTHAVQVKTGRTYSLRSHTFSLHKQKAQWWCHTQKGGFAASGSGQPEIMPVVKLELYFSAGK